MIKTYVAAFDLISGAQPPLIVDPNSGWSSGATWNDLVIERRKFDETDISESKTSNCSLVIRLPSSPATTEHKSNLEHQNDSSKRGNICLFAAGVPKQICTHQQDEILLLTLSSNAVNQAAYGWCGKSNPELVDQHQFHDAQIEHIGMALKAEAETGYLSGRLYGESLCVALSTHLISQYSVVKNAVCDHKGGIAPHRLRRVVEYIRDNLSEEVRLSKLAKVAGLSQHRFAHNFKDSTGLAPHQYVIRERVQLAKQMLSETSLTVTAIAHAVGCHSPSRFTILFRRATGVTPSTYRASFK